MGITDSRFLSFFMGIGVVFAAIGVLPLCFHVVGIMASLFYKWYKLPLYFHMTMIGIGILVFIVSFSIALIKATNKVPS